MLGAAVTQRRSHRDAGFAVCAHDLPPFSRVEVDDVALVPGRHPVIAILHESQADAAVAEITLRTTHAHVHLSKEKLVHRFPATCQDRFEWISVEVTQRDSQIQTGVDDAGRADRDLIPAREACGAVSAVPVLLPGREGTDAIEEGSELLLHVLTG
jgi:hypothetical protein